MADQFEHAQETDRFFKLHHPCDKASRFAAKMGGVHFVRFLFVGLADDIVVEEVCIDTRLQPGPQTPARVCDFLVRFRDPQKPNVVQLGDGEFQARPKGDELSRGMGYGDFIYQDMNGNPPEQGMHYEPFVAFLFLTGDPPEKSNVQMELRGTVAKFQVRVIFLALAHIDAELFLDQIESGKLHHSLLHWVSPMKGANKPATIQRWMKVADQLVPLADKGDMKVVAITFAEQAGRKALWKKETENWNVSHSTLLEEWTAEAVDNTRRQTRLETRLEDCRNHLLTVLNAKSGGKVPQFLQGRIERQQDPDTLENWFAIAAVSQTLAEFRTKAGI